MYAPLLGSRSLCDLYVFRQRLRVSWAYIGCKFSPLNTDGDTYLLFDYNLSRCVHSPSYLVRVGEIFGRPKQQLR